MEMEARSSELKRRIAGLIGAGGRERAKEFLADEQFLFSLFSRLEENKSDASERKLCFCLVLVLLACWKASASAKPLPGFVLSYFKLHNGYFLVSYSKLESSLDIFTNHRSAIEEKASQPDSLMVFFPNKYIKEKRLYVLRLEDVERIVKSDSWEKLVDPQVCQCWIRFLEAGLPGLTSQKLKASSSLTNELESNTTASNSTLAKRLLSRTLVKQKSSQLQGPGEVRESKFKRNHDAVSSCSPFAEETDSCFQAVAAQDLGHNNFLRVHAKHTSAKTPQTDPRSSESVSMKLEEQLASKVVVKSPHKRTRTTIEDHMDLRLQKPRDFSPSQHRPQSLAVDPLDGSASLRGKVLAYTLPPDVKPRFFPAS
jgi:hypothetical protein